MSRAGKGASQAVGTASAESLRKTGGWPGRQVSEERGR